MSGGSSFTQISCAFQHRVRNLHPLGGFSGFPGGHVFRTTLASTAWIDISPPIDLPFNAIALDDPALLTVADQTLDLLLKVDAEIRKFVSPGS